MVLRQSGCCSYGDHLGVLSAWGHEMGFEASGLCATRVPGFVLPSPGKGPGLLPAVLPAWSWVGQVRCFPASPPASAARPRSGSIHYPWSSLHLHVDGGPLASPLGASHFPDTVS